jgi:hypothetical protein
MKNRIRSIFWIETVLASLAALLAVITGLWPEWIELVFHIDPDSHSGSAEWKLVVALWFAAVLLIALALRDWRKQPLGA